MSGKPGMFPSPPEVGFIRLRPLKVPNSGKPEFGWEVARGGGTADSKKEPPPLTPPHTRSANALLAGEGSAPSQLCRACEQTQ
jgi:hypothetical protein